MIEAACDTLFLSVSNQYPQALWEAVQLFPSCLLETELPGPGDSAMGDEWCGRCGSSRHHR